MTLESKKGGRRRGGEMRNGRRSYHAGGCQYCIICVQQFSTDESSEGGRCSQQPHVAREERNHHTDTEQILRVCRGRG